ncbi:MAG: aldolase [Candidatus Tectimicrobiota bacterium]|nr:MAG: aldolase [Candidatus Tectomicrobia bacterium]
MASQDVAVREEIVAVCRRLYERGLIAGTEGNVSVRVAPERVWMTPAACHKGLLVPEALVCVDMDGQVCAGQGRPSSELPMHLALYRRRPEIRAVIHAHPPVATALTVAGYRLEVALLPEAVVLLGEVPTVPYQTPTTPAFAEAVGAALQRADAALLENHGSVTVGLSLQEAFNRMETVERVAYVLYLAKSLGRVQLLPPAAVASLRALRQE